jgi:hypothetical protein
VAGAPGGPVRPGGVQGGPRGGPRRDAGGMRRAFALACTQCCHRPTLSPLL